MTESSGCLQCWDYSSKLLSSKDKRDTQIWEISVKPNKKAGGATVNFVFHLTDGKSKRLEYPFTIHASTSYRDYCAPIEVAGFNETEKVEEEKSENQNDTMKEITQRFSFLFKSGLVFDEKSKEFTQIM